MSSTRWIVTAATLMLSAGACATAEPAGSEGNVDAHRRVDARTTDASDVDAPSVDARTPIDAGAIDASNIDARVVDAPGCTTMLLQRLTNATFDAAPLGTGWSETPIDPMYPLITADDGVPEDTAPNKAWLGGIESGDDELHQDVAIPAGTTQLLLRGKYDVRTDEFFPGVYDDSQVDLVSTGGAVLENVLSVDDDGATTGWTSFQRLFSQSYAGQTVRVRLQSHNDDTDVTSFFYDSLALEATVCQ
ncbi:MAG TPA: hypothetical protein VHE35_16680 [Kofleriaceae bacterium]|nr:hypothetical protein [Kofleriaceae bacterium]